MLIEVPSNKIIDFGTPSPTNCMINLWGTATSSAVNFYGFGIGGYIMRYQVPYNGNHIFYTNDSTNTSPTEMARFSSSG